MTWFRWWHSVIRNTFRPMTEDKAEKWHKRITLIYAFAAWNALGLVFYGVSRKPNTENSNDPPSSSFLGSKNMKIIKVNNFKVTIEDKKADEQIDEVDSA